MHELLVRSMLQVSKVSVADPVQDGSVPVLLGKLDLNPNQIKLKSRIRIPMNSTRRYYALLRIRIRDPLTF
jgi:hypothetical protein